MWARLADARPIRPIGLMVRRREARFLRTRQRDLFQIAAEALDSPAGFLQVFRLGGVRDAERGPETKGRPVHYRDAFSLEELGDEILVSAQLLAGRRHLADG